MTDGEQKTLAGLVETLRARSNAAFPWNLEEMSTLAYVADEVEAASRAEAESIERIIRDAIIDYQGMYASAPNDEAEREPVERATTANNWLVSHGFAPEKTIWDKEESPCL